MKRLPYLLLVLIAGLFSLPSNTIAATFTDADWSGLRGPTGTNGRIAALAKDESGNLYVGGNFTSAGTINANHVAKWDGSSWSSLGSSGIGGGTNQPVRALAVMSGEVYAGGEFTSTDSGAAIYVAKWNGTSWAPLGGGPGGVVNALLAHGGSLYAGGPFGISRWTGSAWLPLGSGVSGSVNAIAVHGSDIYVGGAFSHAGGSTALYIARWNGTAWSPVGSGMNSIVNALASDGTTLYAGGQFSNAGGVFAPAAARWNGTSWSALGSGLNGVVKSIIIESGSPVFGGSFSASGSTSLLNIARWSDPIWSPLQSGLAGIAAEVTALTTYRSGFCAGGSFSQSGTVTLQNLAGWGTADNLPLLGWQRLELGPNAPVHSIATLGGFVYAGGEFTGIDGVKANRIARWNGFSWSPMGDGVNGTVRAIAVSGTDVYVGGDFTTAGGIPANYIARWNGTGWSALGGGLAAPGYIAPGVKAIAVSGFNVYAGGTFDSASGFSGWLSSRNIAVWNGSFWNALGTGISGVSVNAIAPNGSDVYVGGEFSTASGAPGNNVALWNGTTWSALGSGTNSEVRSLAYGGGRLYAGGNFTSAGGTAAYRVGFWNGSSWSGMGLIGPNPAVRAIALRNNDLYVAGTFDKTGTLPTPRISRWNGNYWSTLGTGLGGNHANALAISPDGRTLHVGGWFVYAGGKAMPYLAIANVLNPSPTPIQAWRMQHFGSYENTGLAANEEDYDKDGMSNLMEWIFGTDPKTPSPSPLVLARDGSNLSLRHPRNLHAANPWAAMQVEFSDTLLSGTWETTGTISYTFALWENHYAVAHLVPVGPGPRRFARIRFTSPAE